EFTQRAFLLGRIDLSQAEAVADLIRAKTEASCRVAAYQLKGRLSERLQGMREQLVKACSRLEIELDFSEEDLEFVSRKELMVVLRSLRREMRCLLESFNRGSVCREGIRMVIVGRPNVGKSSILNTLVERERAIVTEVPGTTRDTVEEALDIGGLLFLITDTAGIRETTDPVEKESIRRTERALDEANLVLLIFDGSESLKIEDKMIIDRVKGLGKQVVAVINKLDLEQRIEKKKLKEWLSEEVLIEVSALERRDVPKLIHTLETTV
ncbi:unnamed protein product, partial [marine sediment metagenome]